MTALSFHFPPYIINCYLGTVIYRGYYLANLEKHGLADVIQRSRSEMNLLQVRLGQRKYHPRALPGLFQDGEGILALAVFTYDRLRPCSLSNILGQQTPKERANEGGASGSC